MTETQAQAFDLMQEFYLSRYYEPKAERPADNVQAAIEFTLDRIAALSQPAPTIQPSAAAELAGELVAKVEWLLAEQKLAVEAVELSGPSADQIMRAAIRLHKANAYAFELLPAILTALKAQPSIEAVEFAAQVVARSKEAEALVKRMVDRFLNWKLPADFQPDNGISAQRPNYGPNVAWEPLGTNLLSYTQAEAMVLHIIEGEHLTALQSSADAGNEHLKRENGNG